MCTATFPCGYLHFVGEVSHVIFHVIYLLPSEPSSPAWLNPQRANWRDERNDLHLWMPSVGAKAKGLLSPQGFGEILQYETNYESAMQVYAPTMLKNCSMLCLWELDYHMRLQKHNIWKARCWYWVFKRIPWICGLSTGSDSIRSLSKVKCIIQRDNAGSERVISGWDVRWSMSPPCFSALLCHPSWLLLFLFSILRVDLHNFCVLESGLNIMHP